MRWRNSIARDPRSKVIHFSTRHGSATVYRERWISAAAPSSRVTSHAHGPCHRSPWSWKLVSPTVQAGSVGKSSSQPPLQTSSKLGPGYVARRGTRGFFQSRSNPVGRWISSCSLAPAAGMIETRRTSVSTRMPGTPPQVCPVAIIAATLGDGDGASRRRRYQRLTQSAVQTHAPAWPSYVPQVAADADPAVLGESMIARCSGLASQAFTVEMGDASDPVPHASVSPPSHE